MDNAYSLFETWQAARNAVVRTAQQFMLGDASPAELGAVLAAEHRARAAFESSQYPACDALTLDDPSATLED